MKSNADAYYQLLLLKYRKLANLSNMLQESFPNFFEHVPYPVLITDARGCFLFFNEAAEKLTGYLQAEALNHHFRMLFTLDDLSDGFLFFYQTMQGCYSENTKFRIRKKDGSTRVIDVLASPIVFDGKVRAALAIVKDITGKDSSVKSERERVRIFKAFNSDLEKWNKKNEMAKEEVHRILDRLHRKLSNSFPEDGAGDRS